jgi:hypothetical protein
MSNIFFSGFCQITDLILNGSTSPLGELTNKTITYAKEPNYYSQGIKSAELILFRGISATSRYEKIPSNFKKPVLDVLDWLYDRGKTDNLTESSQNCLQQLKNTFLSGYDWKAVGGMVTNGALWLPSSIHFTYTDGVTVNEFKIWFSNEHFEIEFPYREIYVLAPISVGGIDYLADHNYQEVAKRLAEETPDKLEERVYKLIGDKDPYTLRITMVFDVYDTINKPFTTKAVWTIIYYGNPDDSEEETYELIKNCILNNSKYDEDRWGEVIPDLFNPLEFILIPYYNELGMINETPIGSTYSPILTYQGGDILPRKYADFYSPTDIIKSLQVIPHLYKSSKIACVGKPKNNNGKIYITDIYPDYQIIPSDDPQAGMMTKLTFDFVRDLEAMVSAGEIITPEGIPPQGIQRVMKKDRLYIVKRSNKVKLTMITRYQMVQDGVIIDE